MDKTFRKGIYKAIALGILVLLGIVLRIIWD